MSAPPKEMIGKRFGRLMVTAQAGINKFQHVCWECVCDCGRTCVVSGSYLRRGTTKSCGCTSKRDITNPLRNLMKKYASGAIGKGRLFSIDEAAFLGLVAKDCYYCGQPPVQTVKINGVVVDGFWYNGLDRIDSLKGYTIDNVVPCCEICNRAKSNMAQADFILYLDRLARFRHDAFRLSRPCWNHEDGASTVKSIQYLESFYEKPSPNAKRIDKDEA